MALVAKARQAGGRVLADAPRRAHEPIELVVVENHRRAVVGRLQVALDAVALVDRREERGSRVLDAALGAIVQSSVGDRAQVLGSIECARRVPPWACGHRGRCTGTHCALILPMPAQ